jgi:hypothetical protein
MVREDGYLCEGRRARSHAASKAARSVVGVLLRSRVGSTGQDRCLQGFARGRPLILDERPLGMAFLASCPVMGALADLDASTPVMSRDLADLGVSTAIVSRDLPISMLSR